MTLVVLTGATRGIGRAAAIELARRGAEVALVGREPERVQAVANESAAAGGGAPVHQHVADLLLMSEVRRLAEAANAGTLKPEELRGGTFTVTSAGRAAGLFVTPLINHPEVAILGVHRIEDRPVVRDGEVVVRRMGNISVTFDHRVVEGKRAAEFGLAVIAQLQMRSL